MPQNSVSIQFLYFADVSDVIVSVTVFGHNLQEKRFCLTVVSVGKGWRMATRR